jgi:mRNA interferase MazF
MGTPPVGAVVLVRFPFSDLSSSKLRPAVALADVGRGDYILYQITSNPYADPAAVELRDEHFSQGSLQRTSYARPGKVFTASDSLIAREIGALKEEVRRVIVEAIGLLLRKSLP